MHSAKLPLILLLSLIAAPALAQDLGESKAEKTDLANPDRISRPPMDAYSLSYTPNRPENAQDILDRDACGAANGKWEREKTEEVRSVGGDDDDADDIDDAQLFGEDDDIDYAKLFGDDDDFDPEEIGIHKHESNPLDIEGCRIDGKKQGRWTYYAGEQPSGFVWFVDDNREGWDVILNEAPERFVRRLRGFHEGKRNGTSFAWDEDGSLILVETWKDDVLDGKFEKYEDALPLVTGTYADGKPVGVWSFYDENEPGKLERRVDYGRRATAQDLPEGADENTVAYWTEWVSDKGVTVVSGFARVDSPESLEAGKRVGKQKFSTETGNPWFDVTYDMSGIHDERVNQLCIPEDNPQKLASYLSFDHEEIKLECKDKSGEVYRTVYFYGSGEVWKTETTLEGIKNNRKSIIEYHKTGEILAKYETRDDVPDGEMRYLNPDGTTMGTSKPAKIENGTGTYRSWWYNGNKREEGKYENGRKTGTWQTWFETGTLEAAQEFSRGTPSGFAREWYANGVLASEFYYKMGVPDGRVFVNFTDGRIGQEATFSMGNLVGLFYEYYHSGTLKSTLDYSKTPQVNALFYSSGERKAEGAVIPGMGDPVRNGTWKFYLKDGKTVWYTAQYSLGSVDSPDASDCSMHGGKFVIDDEERTVGCVMSIVNRTVPSTPLDIREGTWAWYNMHGGIEKRGSIHFGHQHGQWEFYYPNGKPMLRGEFELDRKTGEWQAFYEDGSKKFDGHYVDGVEDGVWTTYYQKTGTPSSRGNYAAGKRVGAWQWFFPDGSVREEGNYENGVETGVWKTYYASGKPEGAGSYENGQRSGEWTWWRESGKVWKTATYFEGKELH